MPDLLWWQRPGHLVVLAPTDEWADRCELYGLFGNAAPLSGEVYTIREVVRTRFAVCLRLVEIRNRPLSLAGERPDEVAFNAAEFQPARTGSIDGLRALLCPPREVKRHVFGEIAEEAFADIFGGRRL